MIEISFSHQLSIVFYILVFMKELKNNILTCLQGLKGSGKFASIRSAGFVFPGVEVKGFGEIAFPVTKEQAEALMKISQKAPFGKGTETILDDSVRRSREINASQLTFSNPDWNKFLNQALKNIKNDLGLEEYDIEANPYKLLIYQEGDFFLPHKDSEKEKGMFGTLIIGLPSRYTGGELIIRFEDEEEVADFAGANSIHKIHLAAFYADCEHEVKPVKSGYRICLVYNLIQKKSGKKIQLHSIQNQARQLAQLFLRDKRNVTRPYIILLGHQYTPENFSADRLKLNDRIRAEALMLAAKRAGFYGEFCLVTSHQMGPPVVDYSSYKSLMSHNSTEMEEVYVEELFIEHWYPKQLPAFDRVIFKEEELITSFPISEGEPIMKESTDYMGNYGPDVMYWYHYGAVMIWSPEVNALLLREQDAKTQLNWIDYFNHQNQISAAEKKAIEHILINGLDTRSRFGKEGNFNVIIDWFISQEAQNFLVMISPARLQFFFEKIDVAEWLRLFRFLPEKDTRRVLDQISTKINKTVLEKWLPTIERMSRDEKLNPLAEEKIKQLPELISDYFMKYEIGISSPALSDLFRLARTSPATEEWTTKMVGAVSGHFDRKYVYQILQDHLLSTGETSDLSEKLLHACSAFLERRISQKPQPPADWSRPVPNSRFYADQIEILREFLESPVEIVFYFKSRKDERKFMERVVKEVLTDLKTHTIRKGSPHTLCITKTRDAYHRSVREWHEDVEMLQRIQQNIER